MSNKIWKLLSEVADVLVSVCLGVCTILSAWLFLYLIFEVIAPAIKLM